MSVLEFNSHNLIPTSEGGGEGTGNYSDLTNKPKINGITLEDNRTSADLSLASHDEVEQIRTNIQDCAKSVSFASYEAMIAELNDAAGTEFKAGQAIFIDTATTIDLKILSSEDESLTYLYNTDEAFMNDIAENGFVQVGYFKLTTIKTGGSDGTNLVHKDDYATSSEAGVVKSGNGLTVTSSTGEVAASIYSKTEYTTISDHRFIGKGTLEHLAEEWTFVMDDGTEVKKRIFVSPITGA